MDCRKKLDLNVLLTFSIAFVLRFAAYFATFVYRFRTDDFGPLIYPAYLSGYDWSTFVSKTDFYYGYGYYWIFAPFFRWISSPYILLMVIVAISGLLIVLSSVLIYHLLVRYFSFPRKWYTAFFAVLPTVFQGDVTARWSFWYRTDNEVPVYFVVWLLVWLLLAAHRQIEENTALRRRVVTGFLTAVCLCWGLTVHERLTALVLAVFAVEILLWLLKKKWLFQPVSFFCSFAVFFILQRILRSKVIDALWRGMQPGRNTSAFSAANIWFLKSFGAIKALILIFFGNLHSFFIRGFGLPAFAAVFCIVWIVRAAGNRWKKEKRSGSLTEKDGSWMDASILVMMVFGICIMIVIAGVAVRWGEAFFIGLVNKQYVYEYKGICYSRYYYVFIGPILFGLFAFCRKKKVLPRGLIEASWGVWAAIELFFFAIVFPYCVRADAMTGSNYIKRALGTFLFIHRSNETRLVVSMGLMFLAMLFLTIAVARPWGKGVQHMASVPVRMLTVSVIFLVLVFAADRGLQFKHKTPKLRFFAADDAADALKMLHEEDCLPQQVYVPNANWSFVVQFMNKELPLLNGAVSDEDLDKDNLVLTKDNTDRYKQAGYEIIDFSDCKVCTNNQAAAQRLEQLAGEQTDIVTEPEEDEDAA